MLRALALLFTLVLTLFQGASEAGEDSWYFAIEADTNLVIAYNAQGERVPLVQGDGNLSARGRWRVDDETLLVQFETAPDDFPMYLLHPDGATLLPYTFREVMQVVAYHEPYAVVMPVTPTVAVSPSILLDLEAATAELLSAETSPIVEAFPCCRFSSDGSVLRYLTRTNVEDAPQSGDFHLQERNLESGEQRTIVTMPRNDQATGEQITMWQPNLEGDRWLVSASGPAPEGSERRRILLSWLITLDGMVEPLSDQEDAPVIYRFWDDRIMAFDPFCEKDCALQVLNSDLEVQLTVTSAEDMTLVRPHYLDDGYLIATVGQEHLRLSENDAPEVIGYFSPRYMSGEFISHDGRWLAVLDDPDTPEEVRIYDAAEDTAVLTHEITGFPFVMFSGAWLILMDNEGRSLNWNIIDLKTGDTAEFSSEADSLAEVLSLDSVIVTHQSDDDEAGLQRYSIEDGESEMLIPGKYVPLSGPYIGDATLR